MSYFAKMNHLRKNNLISFLSYMYTLVRRGIHFCYTKIISPKSLDEDDHRHEFILNTILTGFITLMGIFEILLIMTHVRDGRTEYGTPFWIFGIFIGIFIGLLTLSRKGKFLLASYLLIFIQYLLVTYTVLRWGVEIPLAILIYAIIIITSSILINTRVSFIVTGIIGTTIITLGYLQIHHITTVDLGWKTTPILINDTIQFTVAFFLIVILTWLSNREIEKSLTRARNSEYALKQERDNLEHTVELRTQEIKSLQAEKVADLYRSAEFGRLSSGLFHDLMKPLTTLVGMIEHLEHHSSEFENLKTYTEKSVHASRRMGSFLATIHKQMSRHVIETTFSCNAELQEAVDILTYRARENNVVLNLVQNDIICITGNPIKFHQIAINLIANAIDAYTKPSQTNRSVEISLIKKHDCLVLLVIDHGCGIPKNLIETIFDPFFTTKEPHQGTGLGLSTTKSIVEKDFHGTITVDTTEGTGSSFVVTIPI